MQVVGFTTDNALRVNETFGWYNKLASVLALLYVRRNKEGPY